ncbi:MAG: PfkB family carbohydrate kinase [Deltaproteobacteria bacterium]
MSTVCVVGSVAFDSIETRNGGVEDVLGGSASYFAVAASFFASVNLVGVVGADFPQVERDFLESKGIDLEGLTVLDGDTFRWKGRYHEDMNIRDTLDLQLNVFADFSPDLPSSYRDNEFVFLANIQPGLQSQVLSQLSSRKLVGADTMDHWIAEDREDLARLLADVDLLSINDSEAVLLSGESNLVRAAGRILDMGPETLVIKRGEYGAIQFGGGDMFAVPAYPLETVVDPTGAGDCFAGGMFGSLARSGEVTRASLRRAIAHGTVIASFAVEDFGLDRLRTLGKDELEQRYDAFVALTQLEG